MGDVVMVPYIDPRVKYEGVSRIRLLNAQRLRELEDVIVVQDNGQPLAVIVPYDLYLEIQRKTCGNEGCNCATDDDDDGLR